MKRHPFNLIELMLALGVIVVGLVSVMALFPIGANANRDAMAENYSAQAAEQMLNSLGCFMRESNDNWTAVLDKIQPLTPTTDPDPVVNATNLTNMIMGQQPIPQPIPGTDYYGTSAGFLSAGSGTIFLKGTDQDKEYRYGDGLRVESSGNSGYKDFEAMAALWRERIMVDNPKDPTTQIGLDLTFGTVLNLEVSWPSQLPYSRRQKARYRLEVFNPNH